MANEKKLQNVNLKIITLPQSVNVIIQIPFIEIPTPKMQKEKRKKDTLVGSKCVLLPPMNQLKLFGTD